MDRRSLLTGIVATLATPSIVKAESLMKLYVPKQVLFGMAEFDWINKTISYHSYVDVFGNVITKRNTISIPNECRHLDRLVNRALYFKRVNKEIGDRWWSENAGWPLPSLLREVNYC